MIRKDNPFWQIEQRAMERERIKRALEEGGRERERLLREYVRIAEMKLLEAVREGKSWAIEMFLKTHGKSLGYGTTAITRVKEPIKSVEVVINAPNGKSPNGKDSASEWLSPPI